MGFKRDGISSGLGDRLGCYLIYSMLGYIFNEDIYTYWISDNNWGKKYPSNIFDYINFPKNLIFVSYDEYKKLDYKELDYRWVYHGFDYIPETMFKSLSEDTQITCSYEEMIAYYQKACNEMFYKKTLPDIIKNRFGIIHIRRGDKGKNNNHNHKIINVLNNKDAQKICEKFIITSDDISEYLKYSGNIIKVNYSDDDKVRTLEEFFTYSHCKIIVQSIVEPGTYGGWSGFSYVPFQLGLALYPDDPPILISLSEEHENTRLTYAKKYSNRPLFNVFHYPLTFLTYATKYSNTPFNILL